MNKLNNYAGIIALAALAGVLYLAFFKKDSDGDSPAAKFLGL